MLTSPPFNAEPQQGSDKNIILKLLWTHPEVVEVMSAKPNLPTYKNSSPSCIGYESAHGFIQKIIRLGLVSSLGSAFASAAVITPLAESPDYVISGEMFGVSDGPAASSVSARFKGSSITVARPISVAPEAALNAEVVAGSGTPDAQFGSRSLPTVFGGYSLTVNNFPDYDPLSVRTQFVDRTGNNSDILVYNFFAYRKKPIPAGVSYTFSAAWLFKAVDTKMSGPIPLGRIISSSFKISTLTPSKQSVRIVVSDADSKKYYISDASSDLDSSTIRLANCRWALFDPVAVLVNGPYGPPQFKRFDNIGVYILFQQSTTEKPLSGTAPLYFIGLHSFEYKLSE